MSSDPIRIALVGAGISSLTLAIGLLALPQQHFSVSIYESHTKERCLANVGAGLALHANAIAAMDLIDARIKKAYFDVATELVARTKMDEMEEVSTTVMLAQGPYKGEIVAELGKAKGRKTVARADLIRALLALVPDGTVQFGRKVARIEEHGQQGVGLVFEDGGEVEADCVLGCDGVHSVVRRYLLGEDHPAALAKNREGWQVYRTLISADEAKKWIDEKYTRTVPIMCGPRGHINCMPLHRGKDVSAGVAMRGVRAEGSTEMPPLNPDDFKDYTQDAQDIVKMIARDTSASWTIMDHDHAPYYYRRRVCIIGDAAHTAMPFAGNGAAQAIEDAAVLHALFAHVSHTSEIEPVFEAYDTIRRPRSQKVVEIARNFGRLYAYAIPEYGNDPVKMKAFFGKSAAFTNNADLKGQNEDAVKLFQKLNASERQDSRLSSAMVEKTVGSVQTTVAVAA